MCSAFAKEFGKKGRKSTERTSHTKLLLQFASHKEPPRIQFPQYLNTDFTCVRKFLKRHYQPRRVS